MAVPTPKARLFDTGAQTANDDLFPEDITPTNSPSSLRVTVALGGASILNVQETVGVSTVGYDLNSGTQLSGDQLYSFDVPVRDAGSYNFQLETSVAIKVLNVEEVRNAEV